MAVLIALIFILYDPIKQLNKAKDSQRQHDFEQIRNALDTYYNDHNCYPTSVPFGSQWQEGSVTYMRKVPQDETCGKINGACYSYITDSQNWCPQWNILFGKTLVPPKDPTIACSLNDSCLPQNYTQEGYNACFVSGSVDCDIVGSSIIEVGSPPPVSTPTPSLPPGLTPTDTPIPSPTPNCSKNYACTGFPTERCNVVAVGTGTYCSSNCDGACL